MEQITDNLYRHPKYYDLVYGSDWKAELDFLVACFARHAERPVKRVFEPACGTGRLLIKLAAAGYQVAGLDLCPEAVAYCNARLARYRFAETASLGDMADFTSPRKFDAAFNMINSFRHLTTEDQARGHLRCVHRALVTGGLYVLGLHLTPTDGEPTQEESWYARKGHLAVISRMQTSHLNRRTRTESVSMTFDVHTPTRAFQLCDAFDFRTYTWRQFQSVIKQAGGWQCVATYDFGYEMEHPIRVGPQTEDVVYVLRKIED